MKLMKMRPPIVKAAALAYAGYKWVEDNPDTLERWGKKAKDQASGKKYQAVVTPPAEAMISLARWVRVNRSDERRALEA